MVGFKFFFYKIEIDKYYLKIHWKITMIAYQILISTFLFELHLDVVIEVPLMVGSLSIGPSPLCNVKCLIMTSHPQKSDTFSGKGSEPPPPAPALDLNGVLYQKVSFKARKFEV